VGFVIVVLGMGDDEDYLEIYGEYVSMRDLAVSTTLSAVLGFAGYLLAPWLLRLLGLNPGREVYIVVGLLFAIIGFLATLPFVRVKRVVEGEG